MDLLSKEYPPLFSSVTASHQAEVVRSIKGIFNDLYETLVEHREDLMHLERRLNEMLYGDQVQLPSVLQGFSHW